jgi:hypothetical protein
MFFLEVGEFDGMGDEPEKGPSSMISALFSLFYGADARMEVGVFRSIPVGRGEVWPKMGHVHHFWCSPQPAQAKTLTGIGPENGVLSA